MDGSTGLILASTREYLDEAARTGLPLAHMIYKIGRGYRLFRAGGARRYPGGLMVLDISGYSGGGPLSNLIEEIYEECRDAGFTGAVLAPGAKVTQGQAALASRLARLWEERGLGLVVPESLSESAPGAHVLIQTALSGGNLARHIERAVEKYGPEKVALEVERVRMDFAVPAKTGTGQVLSQEELDALLEAHRPRVHYSEELAASYFIYRSRRRTHFVLFDNAATIRRKIVIARRFGVKAAFLFYPSVRDILDEIRGPGV